MLKVFLDVTDLWYMNFSARLDLKLYIMLQKSAVLIGYTLNGHQEVSSKASE